MKKLEVFDPAMCCSTGVCGVDVDPTLAQFAADLKWVEEHGMTVARHNLGQEPQAFASNPAVVKEMEAGMDRLPILAVDGHIVSTGMYPSRAATGTEAGNRTDGCGKAAYQDCRACCSPEVRLLLISENLDHGAARHPDPITCSLPAKVASAKLPLSCATGLASRRGWKEDINCQHRPGIQSGRGAGCRLGSDAHGLSRVPTGFLPSTSTRRLQRMRTASAWWLPTGASCRLRPFKAWKNSSPVRALWKSRPSMNSPNSWATRRLLRTSTTLSSIRRRPGTRCDF